MTRFNIAYERQQLRIIALEYEKQGFEVSIESRIPDSTYEFDAIARRQRDGQLVFIELLNGQRSDRAIEEKIHALELAAERFPNAKIDLRYLDADRAPYVAMLERDARSVNSEDLERAIKKRLPASTKDELEGAGAILVLWGLHVWTLRAAARRLVQESSSTDNVRDLYNQLLQAGVLNAPEQIDDAITLDFFEIYEAVMAATQGAVICMKYLDQLRKHVQSVRAQLRRKLKAKVLADHGVAP